MTVKIGKKYNNNYGTIVQIIGFTTSDHPVFEVIKVGKKSTLYEGCVKESDHLTHVFEEEWKEYKEPRTFNKWVNLYENKHTKEIYKGSRVFDSEEDAKNTVSAIAPIATIQINWTEEIN